MPVVKAWQVAIAQVTSAADVASMFFAVCTEVADLTDDEKRIRNRLRTEVGDLIEERNVIAHAAWYLAAHRDGEVDFGQPLAFRDKVTKEGLEGLAIRDKPYTPAQLEELANRASEVTSLVIAFYQGCAPRGPDRPRVADWLEIVDGRVVRKSLEGWAPPSSTS
jgi:hypothetical protein